MKKIKKWMKGISSYLKTNIENVIIFFSVLFGIFESYIFFSNQSKKNKIGENNKKIKNNENEKRMLETRQVSTEQKIDNAEEKELDILDQTDKKISKANSREEEELKKIEEEKKNLQEEIKNGKIEIAASVLHQRKSGEV